MRSATHALFFTLVFTQMSAQNLPYKIGNKILVVSGGGARGAWGVGLLDTLVKKEGGYKAVMGVSTGSTTAPMILLQKLDKLQEIYTSVSQKDIFNVNPFKVTIKNNVVTTKLRLGLAVWRLILGKKTIGETQNFRKLIDRFFIKEDYDGIKNSGLELAVGVTNMSTGQFELKSIANNSFDRMKDWIWASANQPLWMSYVSMDGADYVDGGLREVVPFVDAVNYAIANEIDTIDVVINNSLDPIEKGWKPNKTWFEGLERVLQVLMLGTQQSSVFMGETLGKLYNCQADSDLRAIALANVGGKPIIINIYAMPQELASTYRNDLAFDKEMMRKILEKGKKFFEVDPSTPALNARVEKIGNPNLISFKINSVVLQKSFAK